MPSVLTGSACSSCGEMFYLRRQVCPRCGATTLADQTFSGKGDVYSYTVISEPPAGFEAQAPYTVALVHLAEGPYVTARLLGIDPQAIFTGMAVEATGGDERLTFRPRRSLVA